MSKYRIVTEEQEPIFIGDSKRNIYYPEYKNFLGFWCRWESYPFCDYFCWSLEKAEEFINKDKNKSFWSLCQCEECKSPRPKLF